MKTTLLFTVLGLLTAVPARAQKDYPRAEVFVGYSLMKTTGTISRSRNTLASGWGASVAGNFHRNLGIEASFGGHYWNHGPVVPFEDSYYLFQVGPRVAFRHDRLTPWAHALFGISQSRIAGADATRTNFAGTFGGGLDVSVHKNVAFRVVQADYVRMHVNTLVSLGGTGGFGIIAGPLPANNLRLSFGVVVRLGGG